jgi:antitoxin FitA
MADVTIRDIDPELLGRLEDLAKAEGRSVEDQARIILEEKLPKYSIEETRRLARKWQERFRGRFFSDSTDLIREDRER